MPRRFENGYFALVVTCLFCITCIGFIAITFAFSKGYQRADQEHAAYYAERDKTEIKHRECLDVATDLNSARECVYSPGTTSRESERAEQDLNAQREMAERAEGMLWAAWIVGIVTVFATIIGVRYVYLTLIATQGMSRETTRIGEAQVRAYLGQDSCAAWEGVGIEFEGVITNCGNSPALDVYMMLELVYWEEEWSGAYRIETIYTQPIAIGAVPSNGRFSTGRIALLGFFEGRESGGSYDIRQANICLLGVDVFDGEVCHYGGIGFFSGLPAYNKGKSHPGRLSPSGNHGNRAKALDAMRVQIGKKK